MTTQDRRITDDAAAPVSVDVPDDQARAASPCSPCSSRWSPTGCSPPPRPSAAFLTGSASMVAEAAHSWADTGNEVFLLIAEQHGQAAARRGAPARLRPGDVHLVAGGGVRALLGRRGGLDLARRHASSSASPARPSYTINYVVLGIAFVLEGIVVPPGLAAGARRGAALGPAPAALRRPHLEPDAARGRSSRTSPRCSASLLAGAGIGLHQLTGQAALRRRRLDR